MTTLAELRSSVANDIRDPLMATFNQAQIDSLINAGISEVARVYPKEVLDDLVPVASTYQYATDALQAFRVEWFRDDTFFASIPQNEDDNSAQGGWELWAGNLILPKRIVDTAVPATDFFRVWGYGGRAQLAADGQVFDGDADAEWAVRFYARWSAYQSMLADRALYKQWQGMTQNSDITPNQLQQDVIVYAQEWNRHKNHLRRLRRV